MKVLDYSDFTEEDLTEELDHVQKCPGVAADKEERLWWRKGAGRP